MLDISLAIQDISGLKKHPNGPGKLLYVNRILVSPTDALVKAFKMVHKAIKSFYHSSVTQKQYKETTMEQTYTGTGQQQATKSGRLDKSMINFILKIV